MFPFFFPVVGCFYRTWMLQFLSISQILINLSSQYYHEGRAPCVTDRECSKKQIKVRSTTLLNTVIWSAALLDLNDTQPYSRPLQTSPRCISLPYLSSTGLPCALQGHQCQLVSASHMRASLELHSEWNCPATLSDPCWEKQGDAFQSSANKGTFAAAAVAKKDVR